VADFVREDCANRATIHQKMIREFEGNPTVRGFELAACIDERTSFDTGYAQWNGKPRRNTPNVI